MSRNESTPIKMPSANLEWFNGRVESLSYELNGRMVVLIYPKWNDHGVLINAPKDESSSMTYARFQGREILAYYDDSKPHYSNLTGHQRKVPVVLHQRPWEVTYSVDGLDYTVTPELLAIRDPRLKGILKTDVIETHMLAHGREWRAISQRKINDCRTTSKYAANFLSLFRVMEDWAPDDGILDTIPEVDFTIAPRMAAASYPGNYSDNRGVRHAALFQRMQNAALWNKAMSLVHFFTGALSQDHLRPRGMSNSVDAYIQALRGMISVYHELTGEYPFFAWGNVTDTPIDPDKAYDEFESRCMKVLNRHRR